MEILYGAKTVIMRSATSAI